MSAFDERDRLRSDGPWLIWVIPLILSLCGLVMIASLSLRNRTCNLCRFNGSYKKISI